MKSNKKINQIANDTHFGIHHSPLWHQQSVRYGFGVVQECARELRSNGYDDAAELLEKHFDTWFDRE
jgi:hypothetical protein